MSTENRRFCPWYTLERFKDILESDDNNMALGLLDSYEHELRCGTVVVQLKTPCLNEYPRGKSGMIWYGQGDASDLLAGLPKGLPDATLARWCTCRAPEARLKYHLSRFVDRFGTYPLLNTVSD